MLYKVNDDKHFREHKKLYALSRQFNFIFVSLLE